MKSTKVNSSSFNSIIHGISYHIISHIFSLKKETCLEHYKTSKSEKPSVFDVWKGSDYISGKRHSQLKIKKQLKMLYS